MLRLASIVGVISVLFGYSAGGPAGMVTGLVAALGVATGLVIFLGQAGTGPMPWIRFRGQAQRVGGLMAALYCFSGAVYGGWDYGWAWGLVGYLGGIALGLCGSTLLSGSGNPAPGKAPLSLPDARRIVDEYTAILGRSRALEPKPLSTLPASKNEVRDAILLIYTQVGDRQAREHLRASFTALADFQDRKSGFGERAVESMRLSWEIEQLEAAMVASSCLPLRGSSKEGNLDLGSFGGKAAG